MRRKNDRALFYLSLLAVALVFAAANGGNIEQLWGLNFLKFFDPALFFLALSALVIVALPPVSSRILSAMGRFSRRGGKTRLIIPALGISLAITVAGLRYPSAVFLLGDGTLRLNQIAFGKIFLPTEILDFVMHVVAYREIFRPLGFEVYHAYYVISAVCGLIFTLGVFRLARYLTPEQLWPAFLLMASSGILVLFFGYVESYSVIAALLPHIYLTGLKAAEGRTRRVTYAIAILIGALVHSVALVIFLPGMILMCAPVRDNQPNRGKRMSIVLATALLLLIVIAYQLHHLGIDALERYLMPLTGRPERQQGIITVDHFLNMFNWLYLAALPALFFAPYLFLRRSLAEICSERRGLFALWTLIPSVYFIFFFAPQLGGPRDWDLFALPVFVLIPSALAIYLSRGRKPLPVQTVPLILLSVILTTSFVAINSSAATSMTRFAEIIEVARFKNLTKEYLNLASAAGTQPGAQHRKIEFLNRAWDQPPYTRYDSLEVLTSLAQQYLNNGDQVRGREYVAQALALDSFDLRSCRTWFHYVREYGTEGDMLEVARTLESRFANDAAGLTTAGIAYWVIGEIENAGRCLKRAYELDNEDWFIMLGYARYLLETGEYRACIHILNRVLRKNVTNFQAHYIAAIAHLKLGEVAKARELVSKARKLQSSDMEVRQLNALEEGLR